MSMPYIGEIRFFPYMRGAPSGWLVCDGSSVSVSDYEYLYSLISTTYGGDGMSQFNLPDLRGRVPIHVGPGNPLASQIGIETVTLTPDQLPTHNHALQATTAAGNTGSPGGQVFASDPNDSFYFAPPTPTAIAMSASMVGAAGQGGAHVNCAPTIALVACIAYDGMYPTRS